MLYALAGCGKSNPVAPVTPNAEKGKIIFAMSAADNIVSGSVTITKDTLTQTSAITIANHTGTVVFNDIQVGTWSIQVRLFDKDGLEIYSGSGTAVVTKNQTTSVRIKVNHNTGNLEIIVDVPDDPEIGPGFNWTVTATGTENYNYQAPITLSGSVTGSDGGYKNQDVGPILVGSPIGPIHVADHHIDSVWVVFNVSYGTVFDNTPTPNISGGELISIRRDGFTARTSVNHVWDQVLLPPPPGAPFAPVDYWDPCQPGQSNLNWNVQGLVTQQGSETITASASGNTEIAAGALVDLAQTITLQPQHNGTVTNQTLVVPVAGQNTYFPNSNDYDDNSGVATTVLTPALNGNTFSFTLRATR
jgi:hypothetical protein